MIAPGTAVRVRDDWPEVLGPVHVRTPHYVRGRLGVVVRHLGDFPDPGELAFARPAGIVALYHVRFEGRALWADASADEVQVEVFGHWLEAV